MSRRIPSRLTHPSLFSGRSWAGVLVLATLIKAQALAQTDYTSPYSFTTVIGDAAGRFAVDGLGIGAPTGIAIDLQGVLYVTCNQYNSIRKVPLSGVPEPFAGVFNVTGSSDGPGATALFNNPNGIGIDSSGNLYVADTGNFTVRKITPGGAVTTLAGTAGMKGSADGTGSAALFNAPFGIAVDGSGNVYVSEFPNDTIRKITPAGVVTTLAGLTGAKGSADGTGTAARFDNPELMAIDASGNLFVADSVSDEIRKVTPAGVVTTIAGAPGKVGANDGPAAGARFYIPSAVAVDASGNLYVADYGNQLLRMITPAGIVSTIAGKPGDRGPVGGTNGEGPTALFAGPFSLISDPTGTLYLGDLNNSIVQKGVPYDVPLLQAQPQSKIVQAGGNATFTVSATGSGPLSYQWNFSGSAIPGAIGSQYTVAAAQAGNSGMYSVTVTDSAGSITSDSATLDVAQVNPTTRLTNISARTQVGTGANILIPGFVVAGSGTETLLIRADGPALSQFNVSGALTQPTLTVYDSSGGLVASNTGWGTNANPSQIASVAAQVNAFALAAGSADCALIINLPPGSYTVHVSGLNNSTGVALAEIYEVSYSGTHLANISTRAQVGTGAGVVISGFVISGPGSEQLLVRADGPALTQFTVAGVLAEPRLDIYDAGQSVIASNVGWETSSDAALTASVANFVNAFALDEKQADSALVVNLPAGAYTMETSGTNGSTGVALAEIYEIP